MTARKDSDTLVLPNSLMGRLCAACSDEWSDYTGHAFVPGVVGEAHRLLRTAAAAITGILEVEMALHVKYCAGWGLSEAAMAAVPEDPACMAYTRFVLERGMAGDILDLHTALSPCVVGYGVIGKALADDPATRRQGNPYLSWIEMYSGSDYRELVGAAVAQLDRLAVSRGGEARFVDLVQAFRAATVLESGFWQMGLNAAGR